MNMISTGAFQTEMDASDKSDKQGTLVNRLVTAWEKKNSKTARAGGASLLALSLAACGGSDDTSFSQSDIDAAVAKVDKTTDNASAITAAIVAVDASASTVAQVKANATAAVDITSDNAAAVAAVDITSDNAEAVSLYLRDAAATEGVTGTSLMTNAELVTAIKAADNDSAVATAVAAATDFATLDALVTAYNDASATPETTQFVLTSVANIFTGGASATTFSGTAGTIDGDTLAGGGGADSLSLTVTVANDDNAAFTSSSIETITVRSTGGTANDAAFVDLSFANVTGMDKLILSRLGDDVEIDDLGSLTTAVELSKTATAADININYDASIVTGTSDTAAITLTSHSGGGDLVINSVETIALTTSGTNDLNVDGDKIGEITVAGSGTYNMDIDASVVKVTASSYTGALTVNTTAAADVTLTGGTGNDTFSLGALLTAADTLDGGVGTDTLTLNDNGAATTFMPASAAISNMETLRLESTDDSAADAHTLDANIASFNTIIIDVSDESDTYAITDYTNETINLVESANNQIDILNVTFNDATGSSDSLTLNVTNNDATTEFTVDDIDSTGGGIETLNLVLNQGKDVGTGTASDISVDDISSTHTTLNISGDADADLGADVALTSATINAGTATGDLTLNIGTATTAVTGGSGIDNFSFAAGTLTSADSVTGGTGADTLTTGNLAAGTMAATVSGVETIVADFGTAGATISGQNMTGVTSITVDAASDEAVSLTNTNATTASVRAGATATNAASDNFTVAWATGSAATHTISIGDNTATPAADVDLGTLTVSGNTGDLNVVSDAFAGNSVFDITANSTKGAFTLTATKALEVDSANAGNGNISASAATSATLNATGGALTVDGTQGFAKATAITVNATKATTLTGAMTGTVASTLTVVSNAAMEQTGNFVSDADVSLVSLTAAGASSSVRYNGVLDVDHVRTLDLTATGGGAVTIDDLEMLGVDNDGSTDIDTAMNISATGVNGTTGSSVTVSAINTAAAATLDTVTITSDSTATVSFTTGGANITITTLDASASLGTNTFDTTTSGGVITLSTGAAKKNTITTELDQEDVITLGASSGEDVYKVMDDTTAADKITNFEAGAGGDLVQIDISAIGNGVTQSFNTVALDSTLIVAIGTDADGVLADADNAVLATDNMLKVTDTFANITAVYGALDLDAETNVGGLLDNEGVLVLWTNGADSFLSSVLFNGADGAAADAGADLLQFVGTSITALTADNFAFI
jgi:hypothetical protein